MNPEEIIDIKNNISSLGESINDLGKVISALKIDRQLTLSSNIPIPPGSACKLTFDSKGLILKGEVLIPDDIPELPIEKITGLKKLLNDGIGSTNTTKGTTIVRNKIQSATGIKINYDEDGLVVSSADLLESDIPNLSIAKIIGLEDRLEFMKSQIENISNEEMIEKTITPGTFPKITYGPNAVYQHIIEKDVHDIGHENSIH